MAKTWSIESSKPPTQDPSYDAEPDYSQLVLTSSTALAPKIFVDTVDAWLHKDQLAGSWEVLVDEEKDKIKKAMASFKGIKGPARAEKMRVSLKHGKVWYPLESKCGHSISVNKNTSPKQSRIQWALRVLKRIMSAECDQPTLRYLKYEGIVEIDGCSLAKV
eukprot:4560546-Karenia_brevis.AAC.1